MKTFSNLTKGLLATLCGIASLACIDKDYVLNDVSREVTIGGEELVVPFANILPILLGDIVTENEFFNSGGEDGAYQILFSSYGDDPTKYESIKVDGISIPAITGLSPKLDPISFSFEELPTSLVMSGISEEFSVEFPTIDNIVKIDPVQISKPLSVSLPVEGAATQGTLSEFIAARLPLVECSDSDEVVFDAEISILEQLNQIDFVQFGCQQHPYGAPFEIKIDLNGLQDVNGGGKLKVRVEFPKGYYLRDEQGNDFPTATHNIFSREVVLEAKQKRLDFLVYLDRIDFGDYTFVDGLLKIDDHIKFGYDLELKLCGGNYNLAASPTFSLSAAPEYKDVEVVINHFDMEGVNYPLNYSFNGMPSGAEVEKVAFKNTYLNFMLKGLEWMEIRDNLTDEKLSVLLNVSLPKCMHFAPHSLLDSDNILTASATTLGNGVDLTLEYIDCKSDEVKQENGALIINSNIAVTVDLHGMDGHTVYVSELTPPSGIIPITVAMAETKLNLDKVNTKVVWSEDQLFDLDFGDKIPSISQTVDVPEMIASVKNIEIGKAGGNGEPVKIGFKLENVGTFPVDELEIDMSINLGKMLRPTQSTLESGIISKNDSGEYILSIKEAWQPNQAALAKEVAFDALENINIQDGKVVLNQSFPVTGSVKISDGQNINLSAEDAKINIEVNIDDIEVRTFTGGVDLSIAPEEMVVELGDFSGVGVDIKNLSLNPILDLKLKDNPTNIPLSGDIAVKLLNSEGKTTSTISVPTINIAGSGATHIVISTPRNAAKFEGVEGVTFLAVEDIANLLADGIPSKIAVAMEVKTDKNDIRTIDLSEAKNGYNIEYQYSVVMPLELGGNTDISYEGSVSGLNSTFVELADTTHGLKIGDIGLIAEFGTTIPFNIVLSAELINAEGTTENIDARLDISNALIKGYTKESGEKSLSKIDLDFNVGDSHSLEGLKNADGIRFKFTLYGTGEDAVLKKSQFIDGKLKLRLRNGITADLKEFFNVAEEE